MKVSKLLYRIRGPNGSFRMSFFATLGANMDAGLFADVASK